MPAAIAAMADSARPSISFASAREALVHLEKLAASAQRPVLFRGERGWYRSSVPSLYRRPRQEQGPLGILVLNLALHFWSDFLWPSVEFRTDGLHLDGELLGDRQAIEQVRSEASYLNTQHQFEPLLASGPSLRHLRDRPFSEFVELLSIRTGEARYNK